MPELKKKNGVIHYETHGQGEPLVILRGLGRSVAHWLGFERELAQDFNVITMDLRGLGRSSLMPSMTLSIFDLADDLKDVLDALGIDKAHILGVSLGGMVTLAMGLKYPERCRSLIPINTSIADDFQLRLTPAALRVMVMGAVARPATLHNDLVELLVGGEMSDEKKSDIVKRYHEIETAEGLPVKTILCQLAAAGRFFVRRRLGSMYVPTLVIYGTDDRFVPNINSRRLVRYIPGATLLPLHGAGHEATLDRPDELRRVLREWTTSK